MSQARCRSCSNGIEVEGFVTLSWIPHALVLHRNIRATPLELWRVGEAQGYTPRRSAKDAPQYTPPSRAQPAKLGSPIFGVVSRFLYSYLKVRASMPLLPACSDDVFRVASRGDGEVLAAFLLGATVQRRMRPDCAGYPNPFLNPFQQGVQ